MTTKQDERCPICGADDPVISTVVVERGEGNPPRIHRHYTCCGERVEGDE